MNSKSTANINADDVWMEWEDVKKEELGYISAYRKYRSAPKNNDNCSGFENLVGLAFSGGGIRSATFGLGVLEALKGKGLLNSIDFLSTVSGGGYIGAWLSANCKRTAERNNKSDQNIPSAEPAWLSPSANWKASIDHLRRYSNYLSPKLSLMSADTWSIGTIWLRNTMPVQLIIFFTIACLLLLPRIFFWLFKNHSKDCLWNYATVLLIFVAGMAIVINIYYLAIATKYDKPNTRISTQRTIQRISVLPLMLVSLGYAGILWEQVKTWGLKDNSFALIIESIWKDLLRVVSLNDPGSLLEKNNIFVILLITTFFSLVLVSFISVYKSSKSKIAFKLVISVLASVIATGVLIGIFSAIMHIFGDGPKSVANNEEALCLAFVWAGPAVLCAFSLTLVILIGLQGRDAPEDIREWWSRLGAWLAIYATVCLVFSMAALYGPLWCTKLYDHGPWKTLSTSWIGTTLAGLFAGKSAVTNGRNGKGVNTKVFEFVAKGTPFVFIAGLLLAVSMLLHLVITNNPISSITTPLAQSDVPSNIGQDRKQNASQIDANNDAYVETTNVILASKIKESSPNFPIDIKHWKSVADTQLLVILKVFGFCFFGVLVLSLRVDINVFSLNNFYRNRLSRCYLGATRKPEERNPHKFTGFDDYDDLNLAELVDDQNHLYGPFHIVNCALNLGGSSDLALHTRHSAIFTLTPLRCGSSYDIKKNNGMVIGQIGYTKTKIYGGTDQPSLGQAISVSGAAASPNMGYHTSSPVSFLMTLFNARLGWWFPNPCMSSCQQSSPSFSLWYLLIELFGLANEKNDFLAISDGGHFENLGSYELIKRKCKVIIISDGECDPDLKFEGLGALIRMCKVDLGATINLDVRSIHPEDQLGWSRNRCAVGTITYDDNSSGTLIYIKASMNGHEDTPVMQYKSSHPDFPHETTGDQFYREDQFESYRNLGFDIASQLFNSFGIEQDIIKNAEHLQKTCSPAIQH